MQPLHLNTIYLVWHIYITIHKILYIMTKKPTPIGYTHSFCFTLESMNVDFVSQTEMLTLKKSLTNEYKPNSPRHSKHQRSVVNLLKRLGAMNSPGLPVHALHPECLPPRVQQQHLLLDLKLFFR